MPKIVDYPRASLSNSLELADAVSSMGGSCSPDMAADRMGRKMSGAFQALMSATTKYGLLSSKGGKLSVLTSYRDIKLSYNDEERKAKLAVAVLSPPLFKAIYERFVGQAIPTAHFEKMLIREFDVPNDQASRVANYFLDGVEAAGLLGANNLLLSNGTTGEQPQSAETTQVKKELDKTQDAPDLENRNVEIEKSTGPSDQTAFSITVRGPGLNSTVAILEEDDLLIVEAILQKVKRRLATT